MIDIWSVGCTVIELLTGSPPYFDLEPVSALFRIVTDDMPPLPFNITSEAHDFLVSCFQRDVGLRSSAKTLLNHRWVNKFNSLKAPTNSNSGAPKNYIETDDTADYSFDFALDENKPEMRLAVQDENQDPDALYTINACKTNKFISRRKNTDLKCRA